MFYFSNKTVQYYPFTTDQSAYFMSALSDSCKDVCSMMDNTYWGLDNCSCQKDPVISGSYLYYKGSPGFFVAFTSYSSSSSSSTGSSPETASPWVLTTAQGAQLSAAILSVWALAWAYRKMTDVLNGGNPET